jgi:predicted MFS family arabinose efflux permease
MRDPNESDSVARVRGFWSVSVGIFTVFTASAIPTPLYPLYQGLFGFSALTLTAIFALYVIGTLCALLLLGNLSDYIGRKPVLMLALAATLLGSIAFVAASGTAELFVGRFLCGLAVGMFGAAGAAALSELEPHGDRSRAALFATVANMIGLVVGSLMAGALAQYAPSFLALPWLLQIVFVLASMILLRPLPARRHLPSRPWRPQTLAVPQSMRHLFAACAAAAFSLSAIMGLFLSLVPTLVRDVLRLHDVAASGAIVALLFAASAAAEIAFRHLATRTAITLGLAGMIVGLAAISGAQITTSVALFLLGASFAGIGQGLALTGVLAAINFASPADHRGEIISSLYVFNYLGLALPVLGVGAAAAKIGLVGATIAFSVLISGIALFALIAIGRVDRHRHPDRSAHHAMAGLRRIG